MADPDPLAPYHEATIPVFDEEAEWVHDAAERFEHASAQDLLAWAIERFHPRLAISAAGGVDGMALIDMAWRIDPSIRVFTLDTGRLPPETYTLFEEIRERYGIAVEFEQPNGQAVAQLVTEHGPNLMYRAVDLRLRCCEIRKVELDREHGGIVKLNPVADWTLDQIWDYVREHEVPYHELFDAGYTSIGCLPCTRPVLPGEPERAGRWWWEEDVDKECGIHCSVGLLGTKSDRERAEEEAAAR